jgi:AraC-like DNA-binding protein
MPGNPAAYLQTGCLPIVHLRAKSYFVGVGTRLVSTEKDTAMNTNETLVETLTKSKIYQDYERAFTEATGLPLTLRPLETWKLALHRKRNENPFCALMAKKSRACASCLQVQQHLCDCSGIEAQTHSCAHGLSETAVPVRLGDKLIGFLQTGQVFHKKPSEAQFAKSAKLLAEWGMQVNEQELRDAFFGGRIFPEKRYEAEVRLLSIFAQQLATLSNQILVQQENAEPPVISRAKDYILQHQSEDLTLGQVAKAVNTSTFYFCKLFKKFAGLNFTDYVSRVRIENAKNLLLNRNLRVSEIAFEVGFQSLTHFNRVFKKLIGQSPTEYRGKLPSM